MKNISAIIFCLLLLRFFSSFGQAGVLDSTFGVNGVSAIIVRTGFNNIALQADGKIIAGGDMGDSLSFKTWGVLARYKSNGFLDSSFGQNGIVKNLEIDGSGKSIALQADGKIIQGGSAYNNNGDIAFYLIRYDTTGKIDSTFNQTGIVFTSFNTIGIPDYGYAVAIQPDGKIIQAGVGQDNTHANFYALVRYNMDGTLDNSFGTGGKILTSDGSTNPQANSAVLQPDGKIIIGGISGGIYHNEFSVLRYNSNGTLDNTFGIGGKVITYFGSGSYLDDDLQYDMALQSDGKILLVGESFAYPDTFNTIALVRFNSNGTLDNGFGTNGKIITRIPNHKNARGYSIAIQPDNKIIVGGDVTEDSWAGTIILVRYKTNGSLDSSFAENGILVSLPSETDDLLLQKDGKILVAAGFIARYLSGLNVGILDFSLRENPVLIYPNPIQSQAVLQYSLIQDEKLSIVLYDMLGKQVQSFVVNETRLRGEHKETLHLSPALSAGNYILNISNGKSIQGVKIVKQK